MEAVEPSCEGSSDDEDVGGGGGVVALSLSSRVRLRLVVLLLLDEAVAKAVTLLLVKAAFPASPV